MYVANKAVPGMAEKVRRISLHSRPQMLAKLDKRSREARVMQRAIDELTAHVGSPSVVERRLIERAARLELFLAKLDERAGPDCVLSERDARQALAWENTYRRTLVALGIEPRRQREPTLGEIVTGVAR